MLNPIYYDAAQTANSPDGLTHATAYPTFAQALSTAVGAAKPIFVNASSNESVTAFATYTGGATEAATIPVICVDFTQNDALAKGAIVTTNSGTSVSLAGYAYCYGFGFSIGSGTASASLLSSNTVATDWTFEFSALKLMSSSTAASIYAGSNGFFPYRMTFINCAFTFGSTSQTIRAYGTVTIKGSQTTIAGVSGSTLPGQLITPYGYSNVSVLVEGVDLSTFLVSGYCLLAYSFTVAANLVVKDCKLAAAASLGTVVAASGIAVTTAIEVIRCAIAGTAGNAVRQRYTGEGAHVDSMAVTLSGGASQDGATVRSRLITTTANACIPKPFEMAVMSVYNATPNVAMQIAFQCIWDASAVPNDNDIWIEVEYLADANDPLGGFVSSNLSTILQSGNPLAAGTGTWNGAGGMTNPKPFLIKTPAFTPAQAGFLTIRIKVGKPSVSTSPIYIDPKPIITLASGTFPNISRSIDLPSGSMMHETAATQLVTQFVVIARPSF